MTYDEQKYNRWKAPGPKKEEDIKQERILRMQYSISIALNNDNPKEKAIAIHIANKNLSQLGIKQGYFAQPPPAKLHDGELTFEKSIWPDIIKDLDMKDI